METNALKTLWTECFGNEDRWIDTFLRTAFDPAHLRMLTRQDRPAAALVWMDAFCGGRKLAYLYGIATHPDFRGQGLCRELMARTHRELARLGYAGTILVPADSGLRQMYKNMGYENFGGIRKIPAQADDPISVRKISPEEYASLRREYLPAGGVVQENGAERYLAACADLYAGKDFLLAMSPDGFGVELLGNSGTAPGILGTLGLSEGTFRVPGEEPFAMFRPLKQENWKPGYFGLAFE